VAGRRHDAAHRRKSKRAGRERGCWLYIPFEQLEECGFKRDEPPPFYLTWPDSGGRPRLMVNLYREE
jgi:hypothetical protein